MRILKFFTHLTILAITPTFLAYPQNNMQTVSFQVVNQRSKQPFPSSQTMSWLGDSGRGSEEQEKKWAQPNTYDDIIQMLEDLESGELERRYSPMQLERINNYIATLANKGILPSEFEEEFELEQDTYDLMYGENSVFQLTRYLESSHECMIIPAVLNGYSGYDIVRCGRISKAWKKTKKFCKKHKKAIIIGAVIIVTVTVVAVAIVAASSASAAAAAAAAGAATGAGEGSSDSSSSESKKSTSKAETSTDSYPSDDSLLLINENNVPMIKASIDENVSSLKDVLMKDKDIQNASVTKNWDEKFFAEKVREIGANIAHNTLDGVAELVKVVPQLCEEVMDLSNKLIPDGIAPLNIGDGGNPIAQFDNLIANGHEAIDKAFSTDQSYLFASDAKANDYKNNFAIGILPLPAGIANLFSNTDNLIKAGNVVDRAGLTRVGRGLMKHGYRGGSLFPKPFGNPAQINQQGEAFLREILNDPHRVILKNKRGGIEIYSQSGRGAYFREDGTFRGFIEYGHK